MDVPNQGARSQSDRTSKEVTERPRIIIIAGPNGAGKTTFAKSFLPAEASCPTFVNADLIAAGLAPFDPSSAAVQAGRVMLSELHRHSRNRASFAFETTLSGRTYLRHIRAWRGSGYEVKLMFLMLNDVQEAIDRVTTRVRQGGHGIPADVIRRRFEKGIVNFHDSYKNAVDAWALYDGSGPSPVLLDWGKKT